MQPRHGRRRYHRADSPDAGKNLIVIGTLGVARDSKHASDVSARVETLASENNRL
ncbi:MAG: hypothetical protein ACLUFV_08955 [Acutalibacteraceae bacterium]